MRETASRHRRSPRIVGLSVATLLTCILSVSQADAEPITYLFDGTGDGSLDQTSFSNASFLVTIQADTTNVFDLHPGVPVIQDLTATIQISGLATVTLTSPTYVFDNQSAQTVGFGTIGQVHDFDLLDLSPPGVGLDTYGLTTSFGPVTGTGEDLYYYQFVNVGTDHGPLSFTSISTATFEAMAYSSVPEPNALVLAAIGFAGILALRGARNSRHPHSTEIPWVSGSAASRG